MADQTFTGTTGNDSITPSSVSSGVTYGAPPGVPVTTQRPGTGADLLDGRGGADSLDGAAGNDELRGGGGGNALAGDGLSDDTIVGASQLSLSVGDAAGVTPGDSDRTVTGFGDTIKAGGGDDDCAGDVLLRGGTGADLSVSVGTGGDGDRHIGIGAAGGARNLVTAFCDRIGAGGGTNRIAGDVALQDATGSTGVALAASAATGGLPAYFGPDGGQGGDGNTLSAFDDVIVGGGSAQFTAGDVLMQRSDGTATLACDVANAVTDFAFGGGGGGSGNTVTLFCDTITVGEADDVVAGDVYREGGSGGIALGVDFSSGLGGTYFNWYTGGGDGNTLTGFADSLVGCGGDDVLSGDVRAVGISGTVSLRTSIGNSGARRNEDFGLLSFHGLGGDNNVARVSTDTIVGGAGSDTLAGDVQAADIGGGVLLSSIVARGGSGGGASGNTVAAFADHLRGDANADALVGDVDVVRAGGDIALSSDVGKGGGVGNAAVVFTDWASGGSGDDSIVGDVRADQVAGRLTLSTTVADGESLGYGEGGSDNTGVGFGDTLAGGAGDDAITGDVQVAACAGGTHLVVDAGCGDRSYSYAGGQGGGSDNSVIAFADAITGGEGDDDLVGDVRIAGGVLEAAVRVGLGGASYNFAAGAGGDGNVCLVCSDTMSGGNGDDVIVGDVVLTGAVLHAGIRVASPGTAPGGDGNTVTVFEDVISGEHGDNAIVGDVTLALGSGIDLAIEAGVPVGGSPVRAGVDNVLAVSGDNITCWDGDDLIVGDVLVLPDGGAATMTVGITAGDGNTVRAFCDTIYAGAGDDTVFGDVSDGTSSLDTLPQVTVEGGSGASVELFRDFIGGGAGDDRLFGGLGDDTLRGGVGNDRMVGDDGDDTFAYFAQALATGDVGAGGFDTIIGSAGDRIEFSTALEAQLLFRGVTLGTSAVDVTIGGSALSGGETNIRLTTADVLVIDLNGDGAFEAAADFRISLQGVTTVTWDAQEHYLLLA